MGLLLAPDPVFCPIDLCDCPFAAALLLIVCYWFYWVSVFFMRHWWVLLFSPVVFIVWLHTRLGSAAQVYDPRLQGWSWSPSIDDGSLKIFFLILRKSSRMQMVKKKSHALAGWLSWLEYHPYTRRFRVWFPVRVCTSGAADGCSFLSPFPLPKKVNKNILSGEDF